MLLVAALTGAGIFIATVLRRLKLDVEQENSFRAMLRTVPRAHFGTGNGNAAPETSAAASN
jgi:hypothetical protein